MRELTYVARRTVEWREAPDPRLRSDAEAIVEDFYLRALSRSAAAEEREYWLAQLDDESAAARERKLEDFLWSLLSCREFRTNH